MEGKEEGEEGGICHPLRGTAALGCCAGATLFIPFKYFLSIHYKRTCTAAGAFLPNLSPRSFL